MKMMIGIKIALKRLESKGNQMMIRVEILEMNYIR